MSSSLEFERFISLTFRKLVVLRSEVFEEAEVPHLLISENALFSEDALIITDSLKYMKEHQDKLLYRQSKERILKIFQKIRELQKKYQTEGEFTAEQRVINGIETIGFKRFLDDYFQSLMTQKNKNHNQQPHSSSTSTISGSHPTSSSSLPSSSHHIVTSATAIANYASVSKHDSIKQNSSSTIISQSSHPRAVSSKHKRTHNIPNGAPIMI